MTWPFYNLECRQAMDELLREGGSLSAYRANKDYGAGPRDGSWAWRLEHEVCRRFGVKYAVACTSGTAALHMALASLELRGGEVITSPFTFSATAAAILHAGGVPVFADVDPITFTITKETVKRALTKRTKAILPVDIFGGMEDRSQWGFGVPLIEDSCQAVGAKIGTHFSGTQGLAGCYSFNGTKNVPAGEAGCLVTNSSKVAEKARLLMNHAESHYKSWVGYNYRPNEMTCLVAYYGLLDLGERNARRQALAGRLNEARHFHKRIFRHIPEEEEGRVWYVYPFRVNSGRKAFVAKMLAQGIAASAGYITPPLHHYPAFRKYCRRKLPIVDDLSFKTLCLISDLTPDKPLDYADHVAECMRKALE